GLDLVDLALADQRRRPHRRERRRQRRHDLEADGARQALCLLETRLHIARFESIVARRFQKWMNDDGPAGALGAAGCPCSFRTQLASLLANSVSCSNNCTGTDGITVEIACL